MRKVAAIAAIMITFFQGSIAAQERKIDIKVPGYTEADAMVALELLRANCRPLGDRFWPDVTAVEVTIGEEHAPYRQVHQWNNSIEIRLKYSDDPQVGPSYASGAGVLSGYTLTYYLGGGEEPGFFVKGKTSQYLCGLSYSEEGKDIFVSVPQLKFVDR